MQCPNCGKEAINVNGRYVCLDCGIELTPEGAPATPVADTPIVANHIVPTLNDAIGTPEPMMATSQTVIPTPPPTVPPMSEAIAPTQITDPPPMPDVMPTVAPLADQTVNPSIAETPFIPQAPAVSSAVPVALEEETPKIQEPVRDYFMNAIEQDASAGAEVPIPAPATNQGSVLPDFPEPTPNIPEPALSPEPPVAPSPEPTNPPVEVAAQPETIIEEATVPTPADSNPVAAPVDYFQPSAIDLAPAEVPNPPQNVTSEITPVDVSEPQPVESEPTPTVTEASVEPASEETVAVLPPENSAYSEPTEPTTEPVVADVGTELPIKTAAVVADFPVTDERSGSVTPVYDPIAEAISSGEPASVDGLVQPVAVSPLAPDTATPANFPGTGSIPSSESVFGTDEVAASPIKKATSIKWVWILLAVIGALLLIGGTVYGFIYFTKNRDANQAEVKNSGETLTISQNVAGKMDEVTDLAVSFNQNLDFSKATPVDPSLSAFFEAPVELKQTWAVGKDGNTNFESTAGSVTGKRIYVKAENSTYVYSNETKAWVKTEGAQLAPTSNFFPINPKGNLFYLGRVENFMSQGEETIDGTSAKKIKITLKPEVIKELLTGANPAFAKIKYEELNLAGLETVAWIDDQDLILKVSVSGSVEVTSDIYSGTVGVTADGKYTYAPQTIVKP